MFVDLDEKRESRDTSRVMREATIGCIRPDDGSGERRATPGMNGL